MYEPTQEIIVAELRLRGIVQVAEILGVSHLLHEALLGMRAILFLAES